MDADQVVEPKLDSFSRALPLPYRVALLSVLAIWLWGLNVQYLADANIDVAALIKYSHRHSSTPLHRRVFELAAAASALFAASLLCFRLLTQGIEPLVLAWDFLPQALLVCLGLLFLLPLHRLSKAGRYRYLGTLRRISIGGIAQTVDGRFGDVLLADALTSYAKVLGDLFVTFCMFFSADTSATGRPNRHCGGSLLVPLIISWPSAIRLRQCLIEYRRCVDNDKSLLTPGKPAMSHLMNAVKYASAFPVIFLSALQRDGEANALGWSPSTLYRLWSLFVLINSLYSFYWDVARDWDLTFFSKSRSDPDHPWGLRRIMLFPSPNYYYAAILIDFCLRFAWSYKLSPHLDHLDDREAGFFCIILLEIFRRWMWIFLRVEAEAIRQNNHIIHDSIRLGDISEGHDKGDYD